MSRVRRQLAAMSRGTGDSHYFQAIASSAMGLTYWLITSEQLTARFMTMRP